MEDKKTILVTGGSGLVGSAVKYVIEDEGQFANERWIFVSSKDGDLSDEIQTKALFAKYRPTHVVHLAATVRGISRTTESLPEVEVFIKNFSIDDNVLSQSHNYGVQKVLSCLATCIFADDIKLPLKETMIHSGPPNESNFGYAHAKRMLDVLNRGFHQTYCDIFTTVIPCNVFGPNDNFSLQNGHVLSSLIHKTYTAKRNSTDLVVYGTGSPLRQFVYSRDLAKLIIWALRNYGEIEPIILSVNEEDEISIQEAASVVADSMKFTGNIIYDSSKTDGQLRKTASNAKLRRYLPDFKFTPFKAAVEETCRWFNENISIARK